MSRGISRPAACPGGYISMALTYLGGFDAGRVGREVSRVGQDFSPRVDDEGVPVRGSFFVVLPNLTISSTLTIAGTDRYNRYNRYNRYKR